ncbi:MAG: bifunctional biotin--[acetyl-CoA-carboxylase] ligase/biotin operon repressor BirA [Pseudomonadota bacterium]
MTPLQFTLLQLLADGRFHSGEQMARHAGVTRGAVWKALHALRGLGVALHAVSGRGYSLVTPCELLNVDAITGVMSPITRAALQSLTLLPTVDSTNAWLMRQREGCGTMACLAEHQGAGRGRRGRQWCSPFGSNLYLSLRCRFDEGMGRLAGLSLAVALAVVRALREADIDDVGVKWPNDIFLQGRKLGGILLEVSGESAGPCWVVIGIGLNVSMPPTAGRMVDQPWADLASMHGGLSRNRLAGRLLHHLLEVIATFQRHGLAAFEQEWRQVDWLYGKPLRLLQPGGETHGIGRGIAADGSLLLEVAGELQCHSFGEISVRLQDVSA